MNAPNSLTKPATRKPAASQTRDSSADLRREASSVGCKLRLSPYLARRNNL